MFKKVKKIKWFTLVELIIIITILAILATIAFISFWQYLASSRDTNRVSDIQSVYKWLSLLRVSTDQTVLPSNSFEIKAGTSILIFQWEVDSWVSRLAKVFWTLKDPKDGTNYFYSTDKQRKQIQLQSYLENSDSQKVILWSIFDNAIAVNNIDYSKRFLYIYWDKVWFLTDNFKQPLQYVLSWSWIDILSSSLSWQSLKTYGLSSWVVIATWITLLPLLDTSLVSTWYCTTVVTWTYMWLTYNLNQQFLQSWSSVSITSQNKLFGSSPINGYTTAIFPFSCANWILTSWVALVWTGVCSNAAYNFNGNFSAPACQALVNGSCNNAFNWACTTWTLSRLIYNSSCWTTSTWKCLWSGWWTDATNCSYTNAACPTATLTANGTNSWTVPWDGSATSITVIISTSWLSNCSWCGIGMSCNGINNMSTSIPDTWTTFSNSCTFQATSLWGTFTKNGGTNCSRWGLWMNWNCSFSGLY